MDAPTAANAYREFVTVACHLIVNQDRAGLSTSVGAGRFARLSGDSAISDGTDGRPLPIDMNFAKREDFAGECESAA